MPWQNMLDASCTFFPFWNASTFALLYSAAEVFQSSSLRFHGLIEVLEPSSEHLNDRTLSWYNRSLR